MPDNYARLVTALGQVADLEADHLLVIQEAAALLEHADALDDAVRAHGTVVTTDRGGTKVHPAIAESRRLRTEAMALLRPVMPEPEEDTRPADRSSAARAMARARWGTR
ncbi:hypothetical protein [Streptomyces sioyaensis]|uniref:hypothetical protein n=1 Tax=Streptomyces sioyaensis TaxID=67364 RepID=UPI0036E0CEE9